MTVLHLPLSVTLLHRRTVPAIAMLLSAVCSPCSAAALTAPAAKTDACAGSPSEAALQTCRKRQHGAQLAKQERLLATLRKRWSTDEPERLRLLNAAQGAFVQYRDAECRLRTEESRGGSAYQVHWLACLTALDRLRNVDLQGLVDNP